MAKIILMAMSLRTGSFNKKLIRVAHQILSQNANPQELEHLSFNDFPLPVYDGDVEATTGIPQSAQMLAQKIVEARALILSTPEYNGGIPGTFKNAIDWVSRIPPMPWNGKHICLLGASPGSLGAIRGLWHSRVPLEAIGAFVYPEMFGLARADSSFDDNGNLKDASVEARLKKLLLHFQSHAMGNLPS